MDIATYGGVSGACHLTSPNHRVGTQLPPRRCYWSMTSSSDNTLYDCNNQWGNLQEHTLGYDYHLLLKHTKEYSTSFQMQWWSPPGHYLAVRQQTWGANGQLLPHRLTIHTLWTLPLQTTAQWYDILLVLIRSKEWLQLCILQIMESRSKYAASEWRALVGHKGTQGWISSFWSSHAGSHAATSVLLWLSPTVYMAEEQFLNWQEVDYDYSLNYLLSPECHKSSSSSTNCRT